MKDRGARSDIGKLVEGLGIHDDFFGSSLTIDRVDDSTSSERGLLGCLRKPLFAAEEFNLGKWFNRIFSAIREKDAMIRKNAKELQDIREYLGIEYSKPPAKPKEFVPKLVKVKKGRKR